MAEGDADDEFVALQSVSHGALVSMGGISVQKLLLFLTNLVLTWGLSVNLYGVYALGNRITGMLLRFGSFGANQSIVRFLPKYRDDPGRRNRVLGLAVLTTVAASALVALALGFGAERINAWTLSHPLVPPVLRLFAVALPFFVLTTLVVSVFRTQEMIEVQVFVRRICLPGARLLAVGGALVLGASVLGVVGAVVLAFVAVAAVAVWLSVSRTSLRPSFSLRRTEAAEFYDHAAPNAVSQVGKLFQSRIDVLLIGLLLTAEATGIYNLAIFLTSIIAIPLLAFNQLLPPIASKLYSEGKHETLNSVYSTITRLVFTGTVVIAAVEFVYRTELLAVFGAAYTEGSLVLAVFVLGRVVASAVGATGWLLLMTDHQYLRMVNSWILGALNVGCSFYFVSEFGLVGAALGTAGSMAVVNLVRLGQLWYLEGLQPFDRRFLKPLGAGVGMAVTMAAARLVLSGSTLLVVGTGAGLLAFVALLFAFGVEPEDKRVFGLLFARYRRGEVAGTHRGTN